MEPPFSPEKRALAFPQGIAAKERPFGEGGMGLHMPNPPDAAPASRRAGSLPDTARRGGSAPEIRWPWPNPKPSGDLRSSLFARPSAISLHTHPDVKCAPPDRQRAPPKRRSSPTSRSASVPVIHAVLVARAVIVPPARAQSQYRRPQIPHPGAELVQRGSVAVRGPGQPRAHERLDHFGLLQDFSSSQSARSSMISIRKSAIRGLISRA